MNRRSFLAGLVAALAAPAIIRTPGLLMPVKPITDATWRGIRAWWEAGYSGLDDEIALFSSGHPAGSFSNTLADCADLSAASLVELQAAIDASGFSVADHMRHRWTNTIRPGVARWAPGNYIDIT